MVAKALLRFQPLLRVNEAVNPEMALLAEGSDVGFDHAERVAVAKMGGGKFYGAAHELPQLPVALDASAVMRCPSVVPALPSAFAPAPRSDRFDPSGEQEPAFWIKFFAKAHGMLS